MYCISNNTQHTKYYFYILRNHDMTFHGTLTTSKIELQSFKQKCRNRKKKNTSTRSFYFYSWLFFPLQCYLYLYCLVLVACSYHSLIRESYREKQLTKQLKQQPYPLADQQTRADKQHTQLVHTYVKQNIYYVYFEVYKVQFIRKKMKSSQHAFFYLQLRYITYYFFYFYQSRLSD